MNKVKLIGIILAAMLPVTANAQELVSNGSFESDTDGWECGYDDYCGIFSNDDDVGSASDGSHWLYLSTNDILNDFETISQTITLPEDTKSLKLSFDETFYLEDDDELNGGFFGVSLSDVDSDDDYFSEYWSSNEDENYSWKNYTAYINNKNLAGKQVELSFFISYDWPWSDSAEVDNVSLTPSDHYQLSVPTKLKSTGEGTSAAIQWHSVDDAKYYQVQLRKNNGTAIKKWKDRKSTSIKLEKYLSKTGIYKFRVRACKADDCGEWSDYKVFSVIL